MAQQTLDFKATSAKVLTDTGEDYTKIGDRLMVRRYGNTRHFELTSEAAGTDGNVVIYPEDIKALLDFLKVFYPEMCKAQPVESPN